MDFTDFRASCDDEGKRLDRVLRALLGKDSSVNIHSLLRKKLIYLNGKKASGEVHVSEGDVIRVASFLLSSEKEKSPEQLSPENEKWLLTHTLFKNPHVWALNKSSGLLVQKSSSSSESLADWVSASSQKQSLSFKPGPLHRLDRFTSGLVLFSQSIEGARLLTECITSHRLVKKYIAVLEGHLEKTETYEDGIVELPEDSSGFSKVKVVAPGSPESKSAISHVKPLSYLTFQKMELTLVEVTIETGRKHQIRSQTAFHGHPLLGDTAYGSKVELQKENNNLPPILLHAKEITFLDDELIKKLELPKKIEAPLPEYFSYFTKNL